MTRSAHGGPRCVKRGFVLRRAAGHEAGERGVRPGNARARALLGGGCPRGGALLGGGCLRGGALLGGGCPKVRRFPSVGGGSTPSNGGETPPHRVIATQRLAAARVSTPSNGEEPPPIRVTATQRLVVVRVATPSNGGEAPPDRVTATEWLAEAGSARWSAERIGSHERVRPSSSGC